MSMIEAMMRATREPLVPPDFISYVSGHTDFNGFLRSGAEIFTMFEMTSLRRSGQLLEDFENVLDFGCGVGRILRYFVPRAERTGCRVFGCDVSKPLIDFVKLHHSYANVYQNQFMPPLKYDSDCFSAIYSFSVFSHLSQETENKWLTELGRVGKTGCLYLITIHGDWFIKNVYREMRWNSENIYRSGFEFRESMQARIPDNDFPDGYEISFHTYDYIMREWSKHFEIIDVIRGDVPDRYLWGNHYFEPEGNVPSFRAMGQDLVVMRKR